MDQDVTTDVRRGRDRSASIAPGRETRHSFSFGAHHDPSNLGFGPMICHNDDVLEPAAGYPDHPHSGLEIVTWVLEGALVHDDATGGRHVLEAGRAQVLSAGTGTRHSEVADRASGRCRFVQSWLRPDDAGGRPAYVAGEAPGLEAGLHQVAGGDALPIGTAGAGLWVGRLGAGTVVELPRAARLHVFAATGSARVGEVDLDATDAVRLVDAGRGEVSTVDGCELLVWAFG